MSTVEAEKFVMPSINVCDFIEIRSAPDARDVQAGICAQVGNETINAVAFTTDGIPYAVGSLFHRNDPSIRENPQRMEDSAGVWDFAQSTLERRDILARLKVLERTIEKRAKL